MTDNSYFVILNANAGTAHATGVTAESVGALFEANGLKATIEANNDRDLAERIKDAMASDAQTIVAAGGDGTITAVAAALVGSEKSLAILPLGTVNALAKDLNIPLNLAEAVAALATGRSHWIDVGEVNGRVFLHKVVVGLIPELAAGREHIRGRQTLSAKIGFMRYFFRRLTRARRIAVAIETSQGERRVERVQAIAVASNAYDEGPGQIFARHGLDRGTLTLYVLRHLTVIDFFRLTTGMLLGHWRSDEALWIESVNAVTIDAHKSMLNVMFDGEVETFQTPFNFSIRPRALSVIVPAVTVEQAAVA